MGDRLGELWGGLDVFVLEEVVVAAFLENLL